MGTHAPTEPEVLGHGREPDPRLHPDADPQPGCRPMRRVGLRGGWGLFAVVALLVGGAWYAGRPDLGGTVRGPTASTSATASKQPEVTPTPDATALVSGLAEGHDLLAPAAPALDSFIASGGHVLLYMQVRNAGTAALRILDGVVPQNGASRDLTAGGLAAGTSAGAMLPSGEQTEVFVRLNVRCGEVLDGPPARSVLLVAEEPGRHPRLERVPLDLLGPYWDEARHAACRTPDPTRDVHAAVVPGSVRASVADDGSLSVSAVVSVHDAAGFAAVVQGPATAADGGRVVVDGGSTASVPLRWYVGRCGASTPPVAPTRAPSYTVELPQESGTGAVDLGPDFAAAWTAQVRAACVQPG